MFSAVSVSRLLTLFVLVVFPGFLYASPAWYVVKSPHFRVVTDGSEADGRRVAADFEQMRHVFSVLFGREDFEAGAPLTVVAARDLDSFRDLNPAAYKKGLDTIAGEFHTGWEKQFALIRLDTFSDQNQTVVYHEYSHSVLHANLHWLPTWLDEGLAEFYAYTRFQAGKTYVGAPSIRLRSLRTMPLLPVSEVLEVNGRSPIYKDGQRADHFYAQSWAMVHYMYLGDGMEGGRKLGLFVKKLQDQEPQEKAFTEVFGDPKRFLDGLDTYLRAFTLNAIVLPPDPRADPKSFSAHQLSPAEIAYEQGCIHVGEKDRTVGKALLEKAEQLDPKLPGPHEELGFLALEQGQTEQARAEWQKAVDLDPSLPRSTFALLMTGKPVAAQSPQELLSTEASLRHVTELAPTYAAPYVELAILEWRLGQMQAAYTDAHRAETLAPWRAGYRILTASILLRGHKPQIAAQYARYVAGHWFGPDHDEAVDLWNQIPAADRGDGPPLALDTPPGSTIARGTLTEVTCGTKLHLTLQPSEPAGAAPLTFVSDGRFLSGWSDTLWMGSDHYSLCNSAVNQPAMIAYKATGVNSGDLLDLEVRDTLPPLFPAATAASSTPSLPPASPAATGGSAGSQP